MWPELYFDWFGFGWIWEGTLGWILFLCPFLDANWYLHQSPIMILFASFGLLPSAPLDCCGIGLLGVYLVFVQGTRTHPFREFYFGLRDASCGVCHDEQIQRRVSRCKILWWKWVWIHTLSHFLELLGLGGVCGSELTVFFYFQVYWHGRVFMPKACLGSISFGS